ncbi:MAG: heme-binding domain-containing protein [Acidimicrobiales bacterium]
MSWLVQRDVENGRRELNFSNWDGDNDSDDLVEAVGDGSMPPRNYRLLHPDARLSDAEKTALIGALQALADEGEDEDRSGSNRGPG